MAKINILAALRQVTSSIKSWVESKNYLTEHQDISGKLNKAGDTMEGHLTLHADPTEAMHASTKQYVDTKVANLVDSAPEALDTLNELAAALGDDANFAATVSEQIGKKVDKVEGMGLSANDYTDEEKAKLAGIAENANNYVLPNAGSDFGGVKTGGDVTITDGIIEVNDNSHAHTIENVTGLQDALDGKSDEGHTHDEYVNQNAFSAIKVGTETLEADSATDTFEIAAGENVTITPDASGDKITISAVDTTYVEATGSASGLMSAADKAKLDKIAEEANKYVHPTSGVAEGTYRTVKVDVNGHVVEGSNPTLAIAEGGTGATTAEGALVNLGLTATAAELNKLDGATVSTDEINYLSGVTGAIQTQLDNKSDKDHKHDDDYVNVTGDTMTGALILNADPTENLGAATKQYVDNAVLVDETELTNMLNEVLA